MPVTVSYPGVYIEEVPSGVRTITGVPTSITAFLGRAVKGPVNEARKLTSFADFERTFGPVSKDMPLGYSVRDFFRNGGTTAIVVRLIRQHRFARPDGMVEDPPPLTLDQMTAQFASTDKLLTLKASSPGSWGNSLMASVDAADLTGLSDADVQARFRVGRDRLFTLTISVPDPNGDPTNPPPPLVLETIANVTNDPGSPRHIDRVLEIESALVRSIPQADGSTTPGAFPASSFAPVKIPPPGGGAERPVTSAEQDGDDLKQDEYLGSPALKTGLHALDDVDLFNLLVLPPDKFEKDLSDSVSPLVTFNDVVLKYCQLRRAFYLIDGKATWDAKAEAVMKFLSGNVETELASVAKGGVVGKNGAIFFPRLEQLDPLRSNQKIKVASAGTIAGIFARTDAERGVWKAPAGLDANLRGASGLAVKITDEENGLLNPLGLNCLRTFPVVGSVVWGARTLNGADRLADADNRYIPVRRLTLFIEESLYRGTQFAVFEPNGIVLWGQLRLAIGSFMQNLFNQGAFAGSKASDAFFVKCDNTTTTQIEIDLGKVVVEVGFAPLKPAEFVILRIQQMAGKFPA